MTLVDTLGHIAAGLRMALTLLAAMVLLSTVRLPPAITDMGTFRVAWTLMALAALVRSAPRAATLLRPGSVPDLLDRVTEIAATGMAVAAFVLLLAARARARGVEPRRVRCGMLASAAVVLACIAVAFA